MTCGAASASPKILLTTPIAWYMARGRQLYRDFVIDIYARTAVMQAHSAGMHLDRMAIADALTEVMGDKIDNIYYKSETTLPFKADLYPENGFLKGGSADNVAMEYGLKFHIDWLKGQKTGFFVDQRENRSLLERYANGRNVLNMFCYTGGFSVYAMRGNANLVHSVDSSAKAIDLTNKNIELNFPGDSRHAAYAEGMPSSISTAWVTNTTLSFWTRRHLPSTAMPCATPCKAIENSMSRLSRRLNRAAYSSLSPARKPSAKKTSVQPYSQPPPCPDAVCASCIS